MVNYGQLWSTIFGQHNFFPEPKVALTKELVYMDFFSWNSTRAKIQIRLQNAFDPQCKWVSEAINVNFTLQFLCICWD